jgi:small subunit ribosomal protein S7
MPRKGPAPKRPVVADPVYGAPIVSQLVNKILVDGKKGLAERIVYDALEGVAAKNGQDAVVTLKKALDNVRPTLEVKSRRVGGSTYQVPIEVAQERRGSLAIRWIVGAARARGEKTMIDRLAGEMLDAANNRGNAVKKKDDTHRMAEANKAFAHYKW